MTIPRLPPHAPGMRIGLLGGSFNPPHEGHALVTRLALTRLRLDRVWWLVTPGNPLKSPAELAALQARVAAAQALVHGPKVAVSDIEAQIGARYTYDTLRWLKHRVPGVDFVWIMVADICGSSISGGTGGELPISSRSWSSTGLGRPCGRCRARPPPRSPARACRRATPPA